MSYLMLSEPRHKSLQPEPGEHVFPLKDWWDSNDDAHDIRVFYKLESYLEIDESIRVVDEDTGEELKLSDSEFQELFEMATGHFESTCMEEEPVSEYE